MNDRNIIRFLWLDTSALIKLFINEPGANNLKNVFESKPVSDSFFTSSFCFYEFFGVLKKKFFKNNKLIDNRYLGFINIMQNYVRSRRIDIDTLSLSPVDIYLEISNYVEKYEIDYTDAIQFVHLKKGMISNWSGQSNAILVTSDKGMIKAAIGERMSYWNPIDGPLNNKIY